MSTQTTLQDLSLLLGAGADPQALAAYLDGLDAEARIQEVRSLSRTALAALYERCQTAAKMSLAEFLPATVTVGQTAVFAGLNNLPLFRTFEKRFTRTPRGTIVGFNFQSMSPVTGPGYFTLEDSGSELLFDYTKVPAQDEVPASWPKVQPNNRGISNFVYRDLHDFCRKVSGDVVIGHATRRGQSLPQYFVLARGSVL